MLKTQIRELLIKVLKEQGITGIEPVVETPTDLTHGDFTTNLALNLKAQNSNLKATVQSSKLLSLNNPRDIALEIVKNLEQRVKTIGLGKVDIAGPGFINFWVSKEELSRQMKDLPGRDEDIIKQGKLQGKKIVIEYTDPNPFKEFHIGHLISNVIGESIARILEWNGASVWRVDYFGDVGVHVAKSIWGLRKLMQEDKLSFSDLSKKRLQERVNYMGKGYALGTRAFESDPAAKNEIGRLNTVLYLAAQRMWMEEGKLPVINYNAENKITEQEIDEVYELYKTGRKWSLDYFETIYRRLGTKFDSYYPESKVGEVGYKLVLDNINKVFEKSEGAVVFKGEKFGLHTRVFINKYNLPTYEAKELGLAPSKYTDFQYDQSIIVVGKEIKEYFSVLIEALTQINPQLGTVTKPICTGMVMLPEGKMSSRSGNVVTVTGLLDQLKEKVIERMDKSLYTDAEIEEISDKVAIAAIKYAFLKISIGQDIVFDIDKSLSLEGNSGPYLQYTFARTQSVLKRGKGEGGKGDFNFTLNALPFILKDEELMLLRTLYKLDEVVADAAEKYSPNILCNYLFTLAQQFNLFYQKYPILKEKEDVRSFRLALTFKVGESLKHGLYLLGIDAPLHM